MKLFDELKWRGLINDVTSPDLEEKLNEGGLTFYIGTDPTGDSLHIGHYSSLLCAKRLKEHGHHPIMLVGGATGFIGDPKATGERNMLTKEVLQHNYDCLSKQIKELFGFEMVNNLDWTKDITIIDFLRDYGKFFNVNYMINKETVKRRLDSGISYTEFSYMLLQALDFLHLYEEKNCTLQLGGQDQWGNITSGLELIRKKHGADVECYGLTMPLITKADGTKFGKSETGTVWLDKNKTSAYEMYQFLVNSEDAKVIDYLKKLTFLTKEEIDALEEKVKTEPHKREAQKALAKEVVTFLHGEEEYEKALKITNALFRGNIQELNAEELGDALKGFEKKEVEDNLLLPDCLVQAGIASSKREAREWINQGSIQINGEKQTSVEFVVSSANAIHDKDTLIKRGKRNYYVITHK
ncbi:tyrosine--tRNA ligase [Amedibacterium intestinale]|mgnify:FL=1|uniref:tyrosine--tRNA ligase n=1 Tax=Amedibacterium intestinale TaxID=2583452 RepID=UPI000E5266A3|nr:tyrosine--tRNA ligase [Amedibacterium intestinale]RHO22210.1 tyrosine--tRNA ligase [Eubacterium sp. AM18-26]RHO26809.1 tyrosine--tRNA ligase [Eubacterium sp. AM18-10LB-B]